MNNQPFLNDQNFFKSTSLKNGHQEEILFTDKIESVNKNNTIAYYDADDYSIKDHKEL